MKSSHRHAVAAVGALALVAGAGTPLLAQRAAQRGRPGPNTVKVVLATFQSPDRPLGVQAAEELRGRLQGDFSLDEAYILPQKDITNTLENSGYRPDSALSTTDLMELGKEVGGDQVLEGRVTKTATGVHEELRLLIKRNNSILAQPLPAVDAKDPGDAAKKLADEFEDARKALPPYKMCENDLRAQKYADAVKDGRMALQAYPNSTFGRLCLLTAFDLGKTGPDSVLSAANAILALDPNSVIALNAAANAYEAKGDKDKVVEYNLRIYRADPSNATIAQSIVQELAQSGAPDKAIPIVDSLLKDNPGDPTMLQTKWKLQLTAASKGDRTMWKQAIATGQQYVRFDTAAANLDYFTRQLGAAQSDSNNAEIIDIATKAATKFPTNVDFPLVVAQTDLKANDDSGAVKWADRATKADPKNTNAWLLELSAYNTMKLSDSVMAVAQRAMAAGADKDKVGPFFIAPAQAAVQKAQDSKARPDWEAALKAAQLADSLAPAPTTKFFVGLASFQIGIDALQNAQTLGKSKAKDDKAKACSEAKVAEDQWATAQINMPAGGSVSKDVANQVLGTIQQYNDAIGQMKTAFCGKGKI